MQKIFLLTIYATMLPMAMTTNTFAENELSRFSLGYSNLTQFRTDPKAQQFGQLTAKYQIGSTDIFKPYVGTGLAYSYQQDANQSSSTKFRTGLAGQAGFSIFLDEKSSLNFDYKFLDLTPDTVRGNSSSAPQSVGLGLEIKF